MTMVLFSHQSHALQTCGPHSSSPHKEVLFIANVIKSHQGSIILDPKQIRRWDANVGLPCPPPFKASYRKGNKEIYFIAVEHVPGPIAPEDKKLSFIPEEVKQETPQGVVVEMVSGGPLPTSAFSKIDNSCNQGGKFVCGEGAYTAVIAGRSGSTVRGGEPVPQVLNESVLASESKTDLFAYRSAQAIISFKQQGIPEEAWPERLVDELERNGIASKEAWSFQHFASWLKSTLGAEPRQIQANWIEPRADKSANKLQQIAAQVDSIREPLILSVIQESIDSHNKTMIFYGSGHYYKLAPVFENAFGSPQIECLK